jgi:hypothetical protein
MKIETLRIYARKSARFRGHNMTKFTGSPTWQTSFCIICKMEMEVTENPAPNDIFVSGEAVALCCPGKEKK